MRNAKVLGSLALGLSLLASSAALAQDAEIYTANANGFGGSVEVSIRVRDGAMVDVSASGDAETDGIGSKAIAELPAAILAAQSFEVDGVSGATVTSEGVRQAAMKCMIEAGLYAAPETEAVMHIEGAQYYTEAANGFFGAVEVSIGVMDGAIVDVIASGASETEGIGSKAIESLPALMLDAQTWDVHGVSGATLSSRAVKNAAKKAMISAGLIEE